MEKDLNIKKVENGFILTWQEKDEAEEWGMGQKSQVFQFDDNNHFETKRELIFFMLEHFEENNQKIEIKAI